MEVPPSQVPDLTKLPADISSHEFIEPVKKINEGQDVDHFLSSQAYKDIVTWMLMLNASMFPRASEDGLGITRWSSGGSPRDVSPMVANLRDLIRNADDMVTTFPPDTGPRRFGNIAFRDWHAGLASKADALLANYLPQDLQVANAHGVQPVVEVKAYFLGSWGSAQRLDYGTGHELSFLAFLACLWKVGAFAEKPDGEEERAIVLHVIHPYLQLVRRLIKVYTLEPAGSHGVWGLDDHFFVPFIFGSAQLAPAITDISNIPTEGSVKGAPDPTAIMKPASVEFWRETNLYFDAIGFIYDVKTGPFWEHSPVLYDISGVKAGWAKINKGMIKMYLAEVLSKFPVVQHFPFGTLFSWERDPDARAMPVSAPVPSQPTPHPSQSNGGGTAAPWAGKPTTMMPPPRTSFLRPGQPAISGRGPPSGGPTSYPSRGPLPPTATRSESGLSDTNSTRAPWAK